ncbi:MAG: PEP-CTERM sorting domain-containing protein [Thermoguttaceae bacterium]
MNTLCNLNRWTLFYRKPASQLACWAVILLIINSNLAQADIVNDSFENGLNGWTASRTGIGYYVAELDNSSYLPTDGNYDAWFSGYAEAGTLPYLMDMSASIISITQTFSASAGQILQCDAMNSSSSTYSGPPGGYANVTALIQVTGTGYNQSFSPSGNSSWTTLSFASFPTSGTYQIVCRVDAHVTDGMELNESPPPTYIYYPATALIDFRLDNVQLVPEPSTLILLFAGVIGFLCRTWRRPGQSIRR